MKLNRKMLYSILISTAILVGCSNQGQKVEPISETHEEIEKEIEVSNQKKKEEEYLKGIDEFISYFAQGYEKFSEHTFKLSANKTLINDEIFVIGYVGSMMEIDDALDKLEELNPTDDYLEVQELFLKSASHYRAIRRDLPDAIDNKNHYMLEFISEEMDKGERYLIEANEKLNSKRPVDLS